MNLREMSRLKVPIICVVIGEGGSGGALGIGVGDRFAMLEYAYFSVITPEGCAGILWRDGSQAPLAAEALKLTSKDLHKLGLIDEIIQEPLGGAHRNMHDAIYNVEKYIIKSIRELKRMKIENLIEDRYQKLRIDRFRFHRNAEFKNNSRQRKNKDCVAGNKTKIKTSTCQSIKQYQREFGTRI